MLHTCKTLVLFLILSLPMLFLGSCGAVYTRPEPTITPTATPAPTIVPTTPAPAPLSIATATPVPATPAPTATPTPEPTPILHTLQSGDTLIGLAQKYGVSVQAIQEINGITNPRGLLIGQQIIIPTDLASRLNQGTPTPQPTLPAMRIGEMTFWEQQNELWALGQTTLQAETAVEGVVVQLDLLDAAGQVVASAQTNLMQTHLLPGDTAGFGFHFSPRPPEFASYQCRIIQAWPAHLPFYHDALSVEHVMAQPVGETLYSLSGEVINRSPDTALDISVDIILYDAAGAVIAVQQGAAHPADLAPGETALFALELLPIHMPVASYHLFASGRRAPDAP